MDPGLNFDILGYSGVEESEQLTCPKISGGDQTTQEKGKAVGCVSGGWFPEKLKEKPAVAFAFLLCKKDVQLQGRSKTEESAEDVDYCLLLLVEVQPPKEVEDA